MLIEGYSASQIVKRKKMSKGYISRIIRELEKNGFIECITPKSKPKFYVTTKKPFSPNKFPNLTPDKYSRLSHRLDMIEVQKCSFICKVLVPPTKDVWDKDYVWHRGVVVQQYSHPFRDLGIIVFRRFKSNKIDKLMIILPRITVHKSEVRSVEDMLNDYAIKASKWIKKKFDMPLGSPRICQKPHFAVGAKEPELIEAIDKGSFDVDGMMADKSPPDFIPEIESTDYRDVVNYLDSIRKIKLLEQQVLNNRRLIQNILDKMIGFGENQTTLINAISSLSELKKKHDFDSLSNIYN